MIQENKLYYSESNTGLVTMQLPIYWQLVFSHVTIGFRKSIPGEVYYYTTFRWYGAPVKCHLQQCLCHLLEL